MRRGAGAVERGGLENRCTCNAYRGFESHPLRHRRSGSSGPGALPSGAWWFRSHGVQVQPDSGAHGGRLGGYAPARSDGRPGGRGMAACPPGGRKRPGRNPWRVRHCCGGAAPRQGQGRRGLCRESAKPRYRECRDRAGSGPTRSRYRSAADQGPLSIAFDSDSDAVSHPVPRIRLARLPDFASGIADADIPAALFRLPFVAAFACPVGAGLHLRPDVPCRTALPVAVS